MKDKIIKPIKPEEVLDGKQEQIPSEMFETVNELIIKHWNGKYSEFRQDELINNYLKKIVGDNKKLRNEIFDNHYLDFEDIYRREGWDVYYDKPAYYESYEPTFKFSKTKK